MPTKNVCISVNDLVLTALTNLFALFVSSMHIERERGKMIVADNLRLFCSENAVEQFTAMFDSLCDMYEITAPDYELSIIQILTRLRGQVPVEEQTLLLLRFMELAYEANTDDDDESNAPDYMEGIFRKAFDSIGLSAQTRADMNSFLLRKAGGNVAVDGAFAVLLLKEFNLAIVSYDGQESLTLNEVPLYPHRFVVWPRNGIIKGHNIAPIYYGTFMSRLFGEAQSSGTSISFCGQNVDFRFPDSDNGLHDFSFCLHSGQFVAIMGGSGVGKSTLLSILNGSLRPDSGKVLINGCDLYGEQTAALQRLIGFVPQDDLLIEELTVWENLMFTARFCFDGESEEQLTRRVTDCLTDLDLLDTKDLRVGSPLNKTISGGQRKRLNIALELIREPLVLFLDEPTSGLSSTDSERIAHLLKKQTYNGRLVVANIHQPSSDIYKLFDHLWILDRGGYPVYNGNPIEAITYFKSAAHMTEAESAVCPTCGNVTPEIILDIIDAYALDSTGRLTATRKVQPREWNEMYKAQTSADEANGTADSNGIGAKESSFAANGHRPSVFRQFCLYLWRNVQCRMQDRQFLAIALLEAPLLAAVVAWLTRYSGEHGYTLYDNHNLVSYYFMAVIVAVFMGMSLTAEEIFHDRLLLKRERFLHLSYSSYITSKIAFAAVVSAIQTLLFVLVGNTLLGIPGLFGLWWLTLFSCSFLSGLTGLFLSRALKSVVAIYITIPVLLIPQILLCGLVVPFNDIDSHSRTGNVPLIGELIPSRWAFEALAVGNFTDNEYNRHFFEAARGQYEAQFFCEGYLKQMRAALATGGDDADRLLHANREYVNSVFHLADTLHADSMKQWIDTTEKELRNRSNRWMRQLDKAKKEWISQHNMQELIDLQYRHTNKKLAQTLTGEGSETLVRVEGESIVPQAGAVYLDPKTTDGRAPFYCHVKVLGRWRIPTPLFNLCVLWLMALANALTLYIYRK